MFREVLVARPSGAADNVGCRCRQGGKEARGSYCPRLSGVFVRDETRNWYLVSAIEYTFAGLFWYHERDTVVALQQRGYRRLPKSMSEPVSQRAIHSSIRAKSLALMLDGVFGFAEERRMVKSQMRCRGRMGGSDCWMTGVPNNGTDCPSLSLISANEQLHAASCLSNRLFPSREVEGCKVDLANCIRRRMWARQLQANAPEAGLARSNVM